MKYALSKELRTSALKKYQRSMWTQYCVGIMVLGYVLFINWGDLTLRITLILCLGMFPVAAFLFIRNMKNKLSIEYELGDNDLIVIEGAKVKKTIPFTAIQKLTETKNGYKVEFNNDQLYIIDKIENKEDLWDELNKKASR